MSTNVSDLSGQPVIIGGGAAGLMTALYLAPTPVVLLSKSPLGAEASSMWAQGGIAAAPHRARASVDVGDADPPNRLLLHVVASFAVAARCRGRRVPGISTSGLAE